MGQNDDKRQQLLEQLLAEYLRDDLSAEEKKKIESWLSEKHQSVHLEEEDYLRIEKEILESVVSHIHQIAVPGTRPSRKINTWWYYAAAIVLLAGSFIGIHLQDHTPDEQHVAQQVQEVYKTVTTTPGQRVKMSLPDSTVVYLHGNSILRYHAYYSEQAERRVFLDQGEAFFEVVHRPELPFVVQTAYAENTVLGTSFNIQLFGDDGRYHLSVNTGKVGFRSLTEDSTMQVVEKGKQLTYNPQNGLTELVDAQIEDLSSWKDNILLLSNNNWEDVKKRLEVWFGVEVHLNNPNVKQQYFTASFKQPRLKEVLAGLQNINHFSYRIDGKEVFIE